MPYLGKNLVCSIFVQELEFLNLEPKVPYLGVFAAIMKNYCHIWNQHVQFPLLQSLVQKKKKKSFNLGQKMPDLSILGLEFEHIILIFQIGTFEFVSLQNFVK